jgi:hypothetical protein
MTTGIVSRCVRAALYAAAVALAAIAGTRGAFAEPIGDPCLNGNLLTASDGTGTVPSPCTVDRKQFLVETLYYQNASKVGGTALAAYPLLRLRAGVARRLELLVDAPSQIAQSGLNGAGLYPTSHTGAGVNYRMVDTYGSALALSATIAAPASLYQPTQTQPRYTLALNEKYRLSHALWLKAVVSAHSSSSIGFNQVYPAMGLGVDLIPSTSTKFSMTMGTHVMATGGAAQSYGDVSVTRLFTRTLAFNVALGTAFNEVVNTKGHYLAAGLNFRP